MDTDIVLLIGFAAGVALLCRVAAVVFDKTPLTAPIVAVGLGIAAGPSGLGFFQYGVHSGHFIALLAELALALILFHDAARIDMRLLRKNLGAPERLLGPGLAMTILLGFGLGALFLDGLHLLEIALVAALLAPTDAALGQAVVTQESVPIRVRQALNVESGLNDGLVVPVVAVLMACAAGTSDAGPYEWLIEGARVSGIGAGVGVVLGLLGAKLMDAIYQAGWTKSGPRAEAVAAIPIATYFIAELFHGSGFLAAFIAGLAMGSTIKRLPRPTFHLTEDIGDYLGLITWTFFGIAAVPFAARCFGADTILYALASLTLVRMIPVALALTGTGFRFDTKLFIGWFGPRGLATVVFAFAVLGREDIAGAERIFGLAVWTILLSVLLHGLTSSSLAKRFGARCAAREGGESVPSHVAVETIVYPSPKRGHPSD